MSTKSSANVSSIKRKVQIVQQPSPISSPTPSKQIKKEPTIEKLKTERQHEITEDDIIRSRLLYEGDQGIDDRRILTLMKTFNKYIFDISPNSDDNSLIIEKLLSSLYSIEHSHRLFQTTYLMDEREQLCYASKSKRMNEQIIQLRQELDQSELRLDEAKQKRLNLLEYDARAATINKLGTRRELRAQQAATLERKHYFEHLQQTFEATYQQRLKQIAVYMRPIFELDEILRQDAHEDSPTEGSSESPVEQLTQPLTPVLPTTKFERQRTNSDSSTASMDADDTNSTARSKRQHKSHLGLNFLSNSLANNQPQALFSTETELFGSQLVNPLLLLSSSSNIS
ncbi:unnamed protein product [Adineta steineri]|uniref:Uncharacterized protein n=1 Tax=Adineta steineri TaxID=433720 RepID=A0A819A7S9_9BILA|nr:unnamed protein product [Adineta steineri]CAF1305145.1 unnamed protein product [Adineta steineri]CAF1321265.1 unnamed protein product [Adineta steineri]CAF3603618.1 unnamed protein product [Adineta steineri]CAF3645199.1 unnamed protein product [Adineta steineri]